MDLVLLHISSPAATSEGGTSRTDLSRQGISAEMRRYKREIEILAKSCEKMGVETKALLVRSYSLRGSPVAQMVRELKRLKPRLIVMGMHRHNRLIEAAFGSASSSVLHKAECPVLLVPENNVLENWLKRREGKRSGRP